MPSSCTRPSKKLIAGGLVGPAVKAGVSLVVGAGLLAALGDVSRFPKAKRLASYFGLVPSTYQSGDARAYHGRITKRGRAQARWLLIEAAEHLRKSPGPCAVSISAWRKNARRCPLDCALAPQPPPLRKKRKR